jgi:hypothetical protein
MAAGRPGGRAMAGSAGRGTVSRCGWIETRVKAGGYGVMVCSALWAELVLASWVQRALMVQVSW